MYVSQILLCKIWKLHELQDEELLAQQLKLKFLGQKQPNMKWIYSRSCQ